MEQNRESYRRKAPANELEARRVRNTKASQNKQDKPEHHEE